MTPDFTQTLYQRNSNGTVQEWTIEVEGPKYRSISGRKDGQKVQSAWTTAKPKNPGKANATTPEQQALKEATAKVKEKEQEGYHADVDKIDEVGFIQCMTALEFKKRLKQVAAAFDAERSVYSQPKLDGNRCITTRFGMFARSGIQIASGPHILRALKPVFDLYPWMIFDGELYNHDLCNDFDELQSIIRKMKPTAEDLAKSERLLQYHVYDMVVSHEGTTDTPFSSRHEVLISVMAELAQAGTNVGGCIHLVDTRLVHSMEEIAECRDRYLADGYEGGMLRFDAPYERREKSQQLMKDKPFEDKEFLIKDVVEGKGGREGAAKLVCLLENGVDTFECALKCKVERMREIYGTREQVIGKQATVRFTGRTPANNMPRWPRCTGIRDIF